MSRTARPAGAADTLKIHEMIAVTTVMYFMLESEGKLSDVSVNGMVYQTNRRREVLNAQDFELLYRGQSGD